MEYLIILGLVAGIIAMPFVVYFICHSKMMSSPTISKAKGFLANTFLIIIIFFPAINDSLRALIEYFSLPVNAYLRALISLFLAIYFIGVEKKNKLLDYSTNAVIILGFVIYFSQEVKSSSVFTYGIFIFAVLFIISGYIENYRKVPQVPEGRLLKSD